MNARKLREGVDNTRATGIFGNVSTDVSEGSSPENAVVVVNVAEQPTGSVGFGAGYSSDSGFSAFVNLSEANLLGRGQSFSLDVNVGENSQSGSISFGNPALFGRDVFGGLDLYYRQVDRAASSFQTTNIGLKPRATFQMGDDTRVGLSYQLSWDEIRDPAANASDIIVDDLGGALTSAVGLTLTHDRRNSKVDPSAGFILSFSQDLAGLGGDSNYSKSVAKGKIFAGLFDESVILSAEAEAGALFSLDGDPTRVTDRFFLGGSTLRGFTASSVGPRDFVDETDDALGGNFYGVGRLEASFPIGFAKETGIFGGVFLDAGSVWGLDNTAGTMGVVDDAPHLRASAGLSLFWATPIGPLEFSYAFPFIYEDSDEIQQFSVNVGTRF